jgi:hypothetical protein
MAVLAANGLLPAASWWHRAHPWPVEPLESLASATIWHFAVSQGLYIWYYSTCMKTSTSLDTYFSFFSCYSTPECFSDKTNFCQWLGTRFGWSEPEPRKLMKTCKNIQHARKRPETLESDLKHARKRPGAKLTCRRSDKDLLQKSAEVLLFKLTRNWVKCLRFLTFSVTWFAKWPPEQRTPAWTSL